MFSYHLENVTFALKFKYNKIYGILTILTADVTMVKVLLITPVNLSPVDYQWKSYCNQLVNLSVRHYK